MSFIGAIASPVRQVMARYAQTVTLPALIIGAGNFTVPSVLRSGGFTGRITACDVTLYTSALGAYLGNWHLPVSEKSDVPEHLKGLLRPDTPETLAASVALLMDLHEVWQVKNPWQTRMIDVYRQRWDDLLDTTLGKLATFKEHVSPVEYQARDGFSLLDEHVPAHAVFASPPTYKGGYERLESLFKVIADWQPPSYREMTDKKLDLYERIASFDAYYVVLEKDIPEVYPILGKPVAVLPRGQGRSIYVHARAAKAVVIRKHVKTSTVGPIWKADDPVTGKETPGFAVITRPQSQRLNELYLSKRIDYSEGAADISIVLTLDGKVIGKADFVKKVTGQWTLPDDTPPLYLRCDLAVPSCEKRLSKLVLLLMQAKEVKAIIDAKLMHRFGWIVTTAFSSGPASMKYRGAFTLHNRKERKKEKIYALNYYANLGEYTLVDLFYLWIKKYKRKGEKDAQNTLLVRE